VRSLALKQLSNTTPRTDRTPGLPQGTVLAQRRSTFGPGGSVLAAPIVDAGRPLDAATRTEMETGFSRDFANIRIHDDARAHDNARALNARAYAAGNHIVFGEGRYRPETSGGRALIAHELAHSIQQSGVQMKADGPMTAAADADLEHQADRAALDVTTGRRAPTLSRIGRPAVFRAIGDPPAGGAAATPAAGPAQKLPPDMTVIKDDPPGIGTTELVVVVGKFGLPVEKGVGPWVKSAYDEAAAGKRLVFSPLIEGNRVAAYKEGGEDYKSIWLGKFGFSTTQGLATAFHSAAKGNQEVKTALADKGVAALVNGMSSGLKASGCDIDHIVEKQMGGTSIPSNLQLLVSKKNQESGRETYQSLVRLVEAIRDPAMRGPGVRKLQIQLQSVTVPSGTSDPSYVVEDLLRKGVVQGSEAVKAAAEGKPVALTAGGVGETVRVRDSGRTPIDSMAKRIVPGMRLLNYVRGPGGAKSKTDHVEGELDSRAIAKTGAATSVVTLNAELAPAGTTGGAGAAASTGGNATTAATPIAPAATTVAEETTPVGEARVLKLPKTGHSKIAFYYPYLSPGTLTSVALDDKGNLTGEGTIKPTVPFLGELHIRYGPDFLEMVAPIGADKLHTPIPAFRFTEGELGLTLSPSFIPKGTLKFEIGPRGKPIILGDLIAKYEGGAFVATGTLKPGTKLPGVSDADGNVEYNSEKGWSGKLRAKSSSIPKSTINAELGFTSDKGAFHAYGTGGITSHIKDTELFLKIGWSGDAVTYSGGATILKPLPLVDKVKLDGGYENEVLTLTGTAAITWKTIASTMHVTYRRKDGEEGKFSGKADVDIKVNKAVGVLSLQFNEAGDYWGHGEVSYPVTKNIIPKLGLELTKDHKVKAFGEVAVNDIELTKKWPSPEGGKLTFIKGVGVTFDIPTPIPAVTVFGRLSASAGLSYSVGPVMLTGINFKGELYPLEDDPQIKAHLAGKLAVPAQADIYGTFGATIGARVALGLVSAEGGVEVTPSLGVKGEGGLKIDADYQSGAFSFEAEAYAQGQMNAALSVNLVATLSGAWGAVSYTWNYPAWNITKNIGPELKLTLGKIAYGKDGEITWPSISQIKVEPEHIDPIEIIKDLVSSRTAEAR
jgi:Domain of unknown function (DUF4157)